MPTRAQGHRHITNASYYQQQAVRTDKNKLKARRKQTIVQEQIRAGKNLGSVNLQRLRKKYARLKIRKQEEKNQPKKTKYYRSIK